MTDGRTLTIERLRAERCRDCRARQGELHHRGCPNERCGRCGRQAVSCGHNIKPNPRQRRIPFIAWANVCASCGMLAPELFSVPERVWRFYIEPRKRDTIVCEPCFIEIAQLIDGGAYMAQHGAPAVLWSAEYRRRKNIPFDQPSPFDDSTVPPDQE